VAYALGIKGRFRIRIRDVKLQRLVNETLMRRLGASPRATKNKPRNQFAAEYDTALTTS
jgi:hypothetical protein